MNDARIDAADNRRPTGSKAAFEFFRRVALSRRWLIIPPIAIGILVVVLMVRSKKDIPRDEIPEQSVKVTVVEANSETIETRVVGYGTAQPSRSWTAIAEVGGRIDSIHPALESGNWIKAGETLAKIDEEDYRLRMLQRQADLDAANASLAELRANKAADAKSLIIEKDLLAVSRRDVARVERLREANAVSVSEVETAEGNLLRQIQAVQRLENALTLYPSRIDSANAKVAMADSVLAESKRNFDRTEINSEINGVLSGVDLEVGQVVAPNERLFEILDNQRIEIEAQISIAQLNQLFPESQSVLTSSTTFDWLTNIRARVVSESGAQKFVWTGKPVRLTESVDAQTRMIGVIVEVVNQTAPRAGDATASKQTSLLSKSPEIGTTSTEADVPNADQFELKPGTYCEVILVGGLQSQIIALPRTAFDGDQVYVVDDESRLQIRPVVRGHGVGDRIIVRSGIKPGEKVIVRPPIPAIEGMLVRLK